MSSLLHASPELDRKLHALCRHAAARQWDVEMALPWDDYELSPLSRVVRGAMAEIYAHTTYAEALGLEVMRRIADAAPAGPVRALAQLQANDEERHVEFFSRVAARLPPVSPQYPSLTLLDEIMRGIDDHAELLVHAQAIESAAQALFLSSTKHCISIMRRTIRLPGQSQVLLLNECIADKIVRDEARHLAFGLCCVRAVVARLTPGERAAMGRRAAESAQLVYGAFDELSAAFAIMGMDSRSSLSSLWSAMQRQFALSGLEIPDEAPTRIGAV